MNMKHEHERVNVTQTCEHNTNMVAHHNHVCIPKYMLKHRPPSLNRDPALTATKSKLMAMTVPHGTVIVMIRATSRRSTGNRLVGHGVDGMDMSMAGSY